MTTSTARSTKSKKEVKDNSDKMMQYIAEMNERLNYLTETITNHGKVLQEYNDLLIRVKSRMGL